MGKQRDKTEDEQGGEPNQHDRSKHDPDLASAVALDGEKPDQDQNRGGHDPMGDCGSRHREALDRAENRDGWGEDAVGIDQRGSRQAQKQDLLRHAATSSAAEALDKTRQRKDSALSPVVETQDQKQVFDRNDQDQRPHDERGSTNEILRAQRCGMRTGKAFAERIEWTGTDISEHNA